MDKVYPFTDYRTVLRFTETEGVADNPRLRCIKIPVPGGLAEDTRINCTVPVPVFHYRNISGFSKLECLIDQAGPGCIFMVLKIRVIISEQ